MKSESSSLFLVFYIQISNFKVCKRGSVSYLFIICGAKGKKIKYAFLTIVIIITLCKVIETMYWYSSIWEFNLDYCHLGGKIILTKSF